MAVLPDDIHDLRGMDTARKVDEMYAYIKYMREHIEFWASNTKKTADDHEKRIKTIEGGS